MRKFLARLFSRVVYRAQRDAEHPLVNVPVDEPVHENDGDILRVNDWDALRGKGQIRFL